MSTAAGPVRTILIDNYDSYTYNLFQQLATINGELPLVVRNDEYTWTELAELDPDNIVISPGPGRPENGGDFGVCGEAIARATVPILGICLGHQGIAVAYGARTSSAREVMHGRLSRVRHEGPLFTGVPQDFEVVRYHSLAIAEPLPRGLRATAWADDGTVMGLAATDRPRYGVQFHPESILTEHGDQIIRNFHDLTLSWLRDNPRGPRPETRPPARTYPVASTGPAERIRVVSRRLAGPIDAETAFLKLHTGSPAAWLDSARPGRDTGRFSYLACAPGGSLSEVVRYEAATRTTRVSAGQRHRVLPDTHVLDYLAGRLAGFELDPDSVTEIPFDFVGGYVGWLGYECTAEEAVGALHRAATDDAALLLADRLVVLDHERDEVYLLALVAAGQQTDAARWLDATEALLAPLRGVRPTDPPEPATERAVAAYPLRGRSQYLKDVQTCQHLLREGETYEVCLTTQFRVDLPIPPMAAYRRLRRINPAPYAAYLDFGDTQVSSSSPERFLKVAPDGTVTAKPIKGTCRRDDDPAEDRRLAERLAADPKERAENLMIVDLIRNDLGRVCVPGSVRVPSLMSIESFETIHQMVSTIEGQLAPGRTAVDCLRASFPGGSMTGAPKIRTMQIIEELEGQARGVYSGAIGFLGVNGSADFNIVIRTLVHHGGSTTVGAGGALTILSEPAREWAEVTLKARAVLNAVNVEVMDEGPGA